MKGNPRRKTHTRSGQLVILCVVLAIVLIILLCMAFHMDSTTKLHNGDTVAQNVASEGSLVEQPQNGGNTVPQMQNTNPEGSPTGHVQDDQTEIFVTQKGEIMVVTMEYGQLSYPSAFIDVIQVCSTTYESGTTLEFEGKVNGRIVPLYFLWFNGESGYEVGRILDTEGQTIVVSVEFFSLPEDLTGSEKETLLAAQETVNDVLTSLEENENYIGK